VEPQDRASRIQAQLGALRLMPSREEAQAATQRMTEALPQDALVWCTLICAMLPSAQGVMQRMHAARKEGKRATKLCFQRTY
jgi:hypothetical protein